MLLDIQPIYQHSKSANKKTGGRLSLPPVFLGPDYVVPEYSRVNLHLVAFFTIALHRKGVLALIVAGTTGFTCFHVAHGGLQSSCFEREDRCVAVSTFVVLQVEFMAEGCFAAISLEFDDAWFKSFVTFCAIAC